MLSFLILVMSCFWKGWVHKMQEDFTWVHLSFVFLFLIALAIKHHSYAVFVSIYSMGFL